MGHRRVDHPTIDRYGASLSGGVRLELRELTQPDGWDFLPAGDAFVTRRVKAADVYWVLFRPKGRREHRRQLGQLAPAAAIASAQVAADATAARREIERA